MVEGPIPSYKRPPLIEVAWSVQFADLAWMTASHAGLFWQRVRDEFPKCQEQPPLPKRREPESLLAPSRPSMRISIRPDLARQWFVSDKGNELIQLQQDRFCFNWRRVRSTDTYPRYAHVRDKFTKYWQVFQEFIKSEGEVDASVDLLEMTYLNHIRKGEGWEEPGDIGKVFPSISFTKESEFLREPGTLACNLVYDIQGSGGRLHVSCQHALLKEQEDSEAFVLELTARGKPAQADENGLSSWFENAHEWIVRGFADLTNAKVQSEFWEREQ